MMRRILAFLTIAAALSIGASAAFIPDSEVCENRDGRQLIIKEFSLPPADNPEQLIEEPFEREGFAYAYSSIVKEEKPFESRMERSETLTVETESDDLSEILAVLDRTIDYNDGAYSGTLRLDHTTLRTEATGYSTKSYTVSDFKTYEGLERNDPGFIPRTTVKNGVTLTLQNIEWAVQGTAVSGDDITVTKYSATASYSARSSYKAADSYVTTAVYTGEVVSSGIASTVYTVTYIGEPIPEPEEEPKPEIELASEQETEQESEQGSEPVIEDVPTFPWMIIAVASLLALTGTVLYLLLRKATKNWRAT